MATEISKYDDVIDSRDVIARLEELRSERESLVDELDMIREAVEETDDDTTVEGGSVEDLEYATSVLEAWDNKYGDELEALEKLNEEGESLSDWTYGVTSIREDHFEDYCCEMLHDCGDLPKNIPHYVVIDWEATADNLKADYTSIDFDGVTYLAR